MYGYKRIIQSLAYAVFTLHYTLVLFHSLNLISSLYTLFIYLYTYVYREPVYLKSSKQSIIAEYRTGRISAEALIKKGVAFKNITEV